MGGKRNTLGRSPEGQDFVALWSHQHRIPLGWALVGLGKDCDRRQMEAYLERSILFSVLLLMALYLHFSLCPSCLSGDGGGRAVCRCKTRSNIVGSTPSAYCKWIYVYCSYFNGGLMINVNKEAFLLGKAQWY